MIEIKSMQEGFRRCGVAHSETAIQYSGDHFTDEQLKELKAEPMLVVTEVPGCTTEEDREVFERQTVKDLKASLDQLEIEYPVNAKKAELIDLIMLNTAWVSEE